MSEKKGIRFKIGSSTQQNQPGTVANDSRLCTASQFFEDDEERDGASVQDRVVQLINEASLLQKGADRVKNIKIVQELIIHKEPALLDNFMDEIMAFQTDKALDVKKAVIVFLEEACKHDPENLFKVIGHLSLQLQSDDVAISKKVMLTLITLYKVAVLWIAEAKVVRDEMEAVWDTLQDIKDNCINMLDSENDGIRTHAVKFVESLTLVNTTRTEDSEKKPEVDLSLDQLPENNKLLNLESMEAEGKLGFDKLVDFLASAHISSMNLMTCLSALTTIAKLRPTYFARVVASCEALHVNLPPTLAKSQVSSVRKNLKMQLLALLRHPMSVEFHGQITTLLTDLGATQSEVVKNLPKIDESRKRKQAEAAHKSKRAKIEIPLDKEDEDDLLKPLVPPTKSNNKSSKMKKEKEQAPKPKPIKPGSENSKQTAIDVTAEDLVPRLTPQNVSDLVLLSMVMLPESMPAQFQSTYTPIAAAGTDAQIHHLARLLATQLTAAGLGKGVYEVQLKYKEKEAEEQRESDKDTKQIIPTIGGQESWPTQEEPVKKSVPLPVLPSARKGIKMFKLASVTNALSRHQMDSMAAGAFQRILNAEQVSNQGNIGMIRSKILISLVSQYGGLLKDELQDFIFTDLKNRSGLAMAWIYQEYANHQGYNVAASGNQSSSPELMANYEDCLTRILNGLIQRDDHRDGLFRRLLLEAPALPKNAINVLKTFCSEESRVEYGMSILEDLIRRRIPLRKEFLEMLIDFCAVPDSTIRTQAISVAQNLHSHPDLQESIEKEALFYLGILKHAQPPAEFLNRIQAAPTNTWSEENVKLCLFLYLKLLPANHKLIHELATVYTIATADIKRAILRVLETPVKGMGMQSPELLLLVENCPKGAETLVTRVIHILTDRASPSPELVRRVRDLYQQRVSDVRFLIPVLNGLEKHEVITALPKLIKLNPVVVKEVFNRLLGVNAVTDTYVSPLTPADLLIALHNIDSSNCDMKTIIRATNLCFQEKTIYTQEVLAMVMKQLMEQTPLPTLFMRTVIQSLAMYPKLSGLVMNILQRLIQKQVWKQKKVWEGFVKCCQRTKPQSFQVLLQLPVPQLKSAFEISPELRIPLLEHIKGYTDNQRAHIPKAIMNILEKDPVEEAKKEAASTKQREEEARLLKEKMKTENTKEEPSHDDSNHNTEQSVAKIQIIGEVNTKEEDQTLNAEVSAEQQHSTEIKQEPKDNVEEPMETSSEDTSFKLTMKVDDPSEDNAIEVIEKSGEECAEAARDGVGADKTGEDETAMEGKEMETSGDEQTKVEEEEMSQEPVAEQESGKSKKKTPTKGRGRGRGRKRGAKK